MRNIFTTLVILAPILAFGQNRRNIEVSKEMKTFHAPVIEKDVISSDKVINSSGFRIELSRPLREFIAIDHQVVAEASVQDVGFESFLASQQSPSWYSQTALKNKNTQMVSVWNSRHKQPLAYDPHIYEVNIDYNANTDYGMNVEYTLYMFFRLMEKRHYMKLT